MTLTENPGRCTFLERSLEGMLGTSGLDGSGLVEAFATDIRLVLRPRDREHLEELDGLRKAMGSWESRRQHERNLREYLGEDVLRSPGNAVVWWMARHDDQIERAVDMIAPLTVLSAAANDEEIPEGYWDLLRGRGKPVEGEPMSGFDHPEPGGVQTPPGHGPIRPAAGQEPPVDLLTAWLDSEGFTEGSDETRVFLDRLARTSDAAGLPEAAESIRRHMRRVGHEGGRPPADSSETGTEDPPAGHIRLLAAASARRRRGRPPGRCGGTIEHREAGRRHRKAWPPKWAVRPGSSTPADGHRAAPARSGPGASDELVPVHRCLYPHLQVRGAAVRPGAAAVRWLGRTHGAALGASGYLAGRSALPGPPSRAGPPRPDRSLAAHCLPHREEPGGRG